jgi:hypothetical protein
MSRKTGNCVTLNTVAGMPNRAMRRAAACRRLQRMKLRRSLRASRSDSSLASEAAEMIQALERRIADLVSLGDEQSIRHLRAVRDRLVATYRLS